MRIAFGLMIASLAAVALPGIAHAVGPGCAQFEILDRNAPRSYDPFSPAPFVDTFQVRVQRTDPAVSSIRFLIIDPTPSGGSPKFGEQGPANYQIDWTPDQSRGVFTTGADSVTEFNSAQVGFRKGVDVGVTTFLLRIPRGQQALAGREAERFEFRYRCYSGNTQYGSEGLQRDGLTELAISTPREVTAYVGGVNSRHGEIDFGQITTPEGRVQTISVSALSTLPYTVSLTTQNGQMLKRTTGAGAIPYTMQLSGQTVRDGSELRCPITPMPSGQSHLLTVRLDGDAVGKQPAGDYRDTITLTFLASDGVPGTSCQLLKTRPL
jgi:spore coat protein U-like protein